MKKSTKQPPKKAKTKKDTRTPKAKSALLKKDKQKTDQDTQQETLQKKKNKKTDITEVIEQVSQAHITEESTQNDVVDVAAEQDGIIPEEMSQDELSRDEAALDDALDVQPDQAQAEQTEQTEENDTALNESLLNEADSNELNTVTLQHQVEALVFSSNTPVSVEKLVKSFEPNKPTLGEVRACLQQLTQDYQNRGVRLVEVASGWRFEVSPHCAPVIVQTMTEKPTRLSRAFLETLALIAYRQPITRAEIEAIRGVVVSTQMIKTLLDHEWIRVVGHKDVPGKPALYATTKTFLDDMGLQKLDDLPPLSEIKAMLPNEEQSKANVSLNEISEQMQQVSATPETPSVADYLDVAQISSLATQAAEQAKHWAVAENEMNVVFEEDD